MTRTEGCFRCCTFKSTRDSSRERATPQLANLSTRRYDSDHQ